MMERNERTETMDTRNFDDGTLRAWLDDDPTLDAGTRARIAAALADDAALADRCARLRANAAVVDGAFAPLAGPEPDATEVAHAYRMVQTRIAAGQHGTWLDRIKGSVTDMTAHNRAARTRRYLFAGGISAVVLAILLVFAPVGSVLSAALDKFRYQPTKVAVITVKASDFPQSQNGAPGTKPATGAKPGTAGAPDQQQAMQELAKYVKVTSSIGQGQLPGNEVKTPAEVQAVTGRAVAVPATGALPAGVPTTPRYYVAKEQTLNATIDLNALRPALQQAGMAALVPASGSTATIDVKVPASSIVSYGIDAMAQAQQAQGGTTQQAPKGVVVAAIGTPTIDFQGLDIPGIINLVTSMNGFPPELAAQLKSADLAHTLIVPVSDQQTVTNPGVNGAASTLIAQNDGSGAVEIFTKNNLMYVVYGSYDSKTVHNIALSVKTS
jgi:anti-sigma factor RsiW